MAGGLALGLLAAWGHARPRPDEGRKRFARCGHFPERRFAAEWLGDNAPGWLDEAAGRQCRQAAKSSV